MEDLEVKAKWLLTGFYGEAETSKRCHTWQLLSDLCKLHWLVVGDFKEILFFHEKGGRQRFERQMCHFWEALDSCNLHDMKISSDGYTWSNRHETITYTKERPNRSMANPT